MRTWRAGDHFASAGGHGLRRIGHRRKKRHLLVEAVMAESTALLTRPSSPWIASMYRLKAMPRATQSAPAPSRFLRQSRPLQGNEGLVCHGIYFLTLSTLNIKRHIRPDVRHPWDKSVNKSGKTRPRHCRKVAQTRAIDCTRILVVSKNDS